MSAAVVEPTASSPAARVPEAPVGEGTSGDRTKTDQIVLLSGLAAFLVLAVVPVLIF